MAPHLCICGQQKLHRRGRERKWAKEGEVGRERVWSWEGWGEGWDVGLRRVRGKIGHMCDQKYCPDTHNSQRINWKYFKINIVIASIKSVKKREGQLCRRWVLSLAVCSVRPAQPIGISLQRVLPPWSTYLLLGPILKGWATLMSQKLGCASNWTSGSPPSGGCIGAHSCHSRQCIHFQESYAAHNNHLSLKKTFFPMKKKWYKIQNNSELF